MKLGTLWVIAASAVLLTACTHETKPGTPLRRSGDEIVVSGQLFHTGTPVVLWMDPGGYDAYRAERRFPLPAATRPAATVTGAGDTRPASAPASQPEALAPRYGVRGDRLSPEEFERVRGGGWDLPLLRRTVDQFVLHYDATGLSRETFRVLHDRRGLSVHFLLDLDGTLYQTLDLKERAWHATTANNRSIGIEIANIGAVVAADADSLNEWYARDGSGGTRIAIPPRLGDGGLRTPGFVGRPARGEPVIGEVQGQWLAQYDFTPQQYESLARLTAALCRIFPALRCDYPRDAEGRLVTHKLTDEELAGYGGLIGHFHIQTNKVDPGPAFDWDRLVRSARERMK